MMTLGLELISSEVVALAELVKNSYDADAQHVLVRLSGPVENGTLLSAESKVEVLDDGLGMSPLIVEGVWLEPATPYRRKEQHSPSGRRILGEKGVGRFAAAKLAKGLELTSRTVGGQEVRLSLDWSVFEDEDAYLDEVPIKWTEGEAASFAPGGEIQRLWGAVAQDHLQGSRRSELVSLPSPNHGTLLRMTDLRTDWTRQLAAEVRTALSRLVSPFAGEDGIIPDLTIVLDVPPELGLEGGVIEPPEHLQRPHYTLEADVDELGYANGWLSLKNGEDRKFDTQLVNARDQVPDRHQPLACGPFSIRLRVWDRDVESLESIAGDLSAKSVRHILDEAAGISVYRDGFRVLPYGEKGNDWLRLDLRRVQSPTRRLSNNQIVGYILIGRDTNPDLTDQTNREGLVEGQALEDLRSSVRQLLALLETERYKIRPRSPRRRRGGLLERIDLGELRNAISQKLPGDQAISTMVSELQEELDRRQQEVGEVLARYHRLATLGQLVDRIVHELSQPLLASRQAATLALNRLTNHAQSAPIEELLADLKSRLNIVRDQTKAASDVLRRIEPFGGRRRGRPPRVNLEDAIADAVALLDAEIKTLGVSVTLPSGFTTVTVDGTELQEVMVNLLTNSLYWLKRVPKRRRAIAITVDRNADRSLSITVEDSGPGVDPSHHDDIFIPYFTTKEGGVGLGLSIAGEIVEDFYGGRLELLPPGELGGARFRATLKRRVGS